MGFPDDRDRVIIRKAERTEKLARDLADWVAEWNDERVKKDLAPIAESDEFELTRLRRLASALYASSKRRPLGTSRSVPKGRRLNAMLSLGQDLRHSVHMPQ